MELAPIGLDPRTRAFYVRTLAVLNEAAFPYLVGGAYALAKHAEIERHTKDLDIFVHRRDRDRVLRALEAAGYRTEVSFPHWLAKAFGNDGFIDVIYSSGNGVVEVDEEWFAYASEGEILGVPVRLCPAEEMIWSKGYVQERERFDGADIAHLIRCRGQSMDWKRVLRRFGEHWRVLFSHLVLFGFIYPAERDAIPDWVLVELAAACGRRPRQARAGRSCLFRHAGIARTISPRHRQVGLPRRPAQAPGLHVARRSRPLDGRDRGGEGLNCALRSPANPPVRQRLCGSFGFFLKCRSGTSDCLSQADRRSSSPTHAVPDLDK